MNIIKIYIKALKLKIFGYKFKIGDPVIIYKNPAWESGSAGVVKDRDVLENSYLVKDITGQRDVEGYWVKEEFMQKIYFTKPNLLQKIWRFIKDL